MTTTLTTNENITEAHNDLFTWSSDAESFLTHKPTGKQIYQMMWYEWKNSQDITDPAIREAVIEFWDALRSIKKAAEESKWETGSEIDPEPKHGENGYCRKCHSYCYSDCEASA